MVQKSNTTVIVNFGRLKKNAEYLSAHLNSETRIMAVVKADAYGHGAVEVAKALDSMVGAFAVNDIHEGIELREHGIDKPILVFEVPQQSTASQYRVHNLTATISAKEHFDWLPNGTSYHLNFDTGMGRLGFRPEEAKQVASLVKERQGLICTGIYSHFATADEPDSELVVKQLQMFKTIRSYFPENLATHIANTGATAFYETEQFNMVRLGIGLYGYPPGETNIEGLVPVLTWKSKLVQLKKIAANTTVSYGAHWKAPVDGHLGILPLGYDDGLKRNLSGKISVRINSKEYPLVGTITMNYCMVFLGEDVYKPGMEAEILYLESSAQKWADEVGSIPYEILTSITPKAPREYIG